MNLIGSLAIAAMGGLDAPSGMTAKSDEIYSLMIALIIIAAVIVAIFIFVARSLKNSEIPSTSTPADEKKANGSETSLIYMLAGRLHELSAEVKQNTDNGELYLVIPNPYCAEKPLVIEFDSYELEFVLCFGGFRGRHYACDDELDTLCNIVMAIVRNGYCVACIRDGESEAGVLVERSLSEKSFDGISDAFKYLPEYSRRLRRSGAYVSFEFWEPSENKCVKSDVE